MNEGLAAANQGNDGRDLFVADLFRVSVGWSRASRRAAAVAASLPRRLKAFCGGMGWVARVSRAPRGGKASPRS